jgi:hypothetical protein
MPNNCWNHPTITANVNIMNGSMHVPEGAIKIFEQGVEGVHMKLTRRVLYKTMIVGT